MSSQRCVMLRIIRGMCQSRNERLLRDLSL